MEALQHGRGTYALAVSAMGKANDTVFVDGNFDHVPYDGPRAVAIYANHSKKQPNAVLQHWPKLPTIAAAGGGGGGGDELLDRMCLVAKEPIARGAEIRFDYEAGGSTYWATPPPETGWRTARMRAPPPSGEPPVFYKPDGSRGAALPLADGGAIPIEPFEWDAPHGGVARLRWLIPHLKHLARLDGPDGSNDLSAATNESIPWALVATHLPGRSAEECRAKWEALAMSDACATPASGT